MKFLVRVIRQVKEINGIWTRKKEEKPSLVTDDMIWYIENPKESTKQPLELINKISKFAEYKINTQTSTVFPYTSNIIQK